MSGIDVLGWAVVAGAVQVAAVLLLKLLSDYPVLNTAWDRLPFHAKVVLFLPWKLADFILWLLPKWVP